MKVTVNKSTAEGIIKAPPSKSMAHRLLISAGLAEGESIVQGISLSQDILATLDCLTAMGAKYELRSNGALKTARIKGNNPKHIKTSARLNCKESGSTLRFFIPLCLLGEIDFTLEGSPTLLKRPMSVYEDICKRRGLTFTNDGKTIKVKGPLGAGDYYIPGNISSQFITGLLFALPLLNEGSLVTIEGKLESRSYIDLTIEALRLFGVKILKEDNYSILIPGGQHFKPQDVTVEGDYSNAAFLDAFNCIGGNVTVEGLAKDSLQGDRIYKEYFKELLEGTPTLSLANCPDLGPVLMALAAAMNGATFTDTARLRIKESDRAQAMADELAKFGARIDIYENSIRVHKGTLHTPTEIISGHNDHRIVMAMTILGTLTGDTEIDWAEAVNKSFPDFFEGIKSLGVNLDIK